MTSVAEATRALAEFKPSQQFFIGIDSDGCAFGSMEIKHKECFIPNTIKYWNLQAVSRYAREAAEFVNLYSMWRGANRWPALVMVFDLLRDRQEVKARGVTPPAADRLRAFINDKRFPQSTDGLKTYLAERPDRELDTAMAWSNAVNACIADMVKGLPPFPFVAESLKFLQGKADTLVVSASPVEEVIHEWEENHIASLVRLFAGEEQGNQAEHLSVAAKGKYAPDRILMIGDTLGDYRAAQSLQARFYPINPGQEEASWQRLFEEAVHKFLAGEYAGAYEYGLLKEFEALLPELPPWKQQRVETFRQPPGGVPAARNTGSPTTKGRQT
jgi:phosphoglycolate phosphatase-like HAD superfamily hydrolase